MKKENDMPTINNHQPYQHPLTPQRVDKLMSGNRENAIYMGIWDTFKDNFRMISKKQQLEQLYDSIYSHEKFMTEAETQATVAGNNLGSVSVFNKIKALAGPANQDRFTYATNKTNELCFYVDNLEVHKENIIDILKKITIADKDLFNSYSEILNDHMLTKQKNASTGQTVARCDDNNKGSNQLFLDYHADLRELLITLGIQKKETMQDILNNFVVKESIDIYDKARTLLPLLSDALNNIKMKIE